jgi:hypothetical protein
MLLSTLRTNPQNGEWEKDFKKALILKMAHGRFGTEIGLGKSIQAPITKVPKHMDTNPSIWLSKNHQGYFT